MMKKLLILLTFVFYTSAYAVTLSASGTMSSSTNVQMIADKNPELLPSASSYAECIATDMSIQITNLRTGRSSVVACSNNGIWSDDLGEVAINDLFSVDIKNVKTTENMATIVICHIQQTGRCFSLAVPVVPPATEATCEADVPEFITLDDILPVKGRAEGMSSYYIGSNATGILTYTAKKTENNMGVLESSGDTSGIHYTVNNLPLAAGSSSWTVEPGTHYLQIDPNMDGVKPGAYRGYLDVKLACE